MDRSKSFFDRILSRKRPTRVMAGVSLLLLLLPFAAAYLDGILEPFLRQGEWRIFLLSPAIIVYILLVSPRMERMGTEVVRDFRPLVASDDEAYESLVQEATRTNPVHELVAFGIGAILGVASALASGMETRFIWTSTYFFLTTVFMYGLLVLVIYGAAASTRLNAALHRQPLRFDILDPTAFEFVGRQSLLLALVFVGGITLSFIFAFQPQSLSDPIFWLSYLPLILVTLLIFFASMRPTHQVLSEEKKRAIQPVEERINRACRELVEQADARQDARNLSAEINALLVYEQRLQAARTWPYNTGMLRTLFFSVFIPAGTVVVKSVVEIFFP